MREQTSEPAHAAPAAPAAAAPPAEEPRHEEPAAAAEPGTRTSRSGSIPLLPKVRSQFYTLTAVLTWRIFPFSVHFAE